MGQPALSCLYVPILARYHTFLVLPVRQIPGHCTVVTTFTLLNYSRDRYGLQKSIIVACILTGLNGWVRYFGSFIDSGEVGRYLLVLFGQCLGAMGQPFLTNAPAKVRVSRLCHSSTISVPLINILPFYSVLGCRFLVSSPPARACNHHCGTFEPTGQCCWLSVSRHHCAFNH